ncbi:MAG: histidine kinase [Planctomycetota bacterium]
MTESNPIDRSRTDVDPSSGQASVSAGKVVFLSGDLMFASRIRGAAEQAGLTFKLSGSLPAEDDAEVRYIILDLSTRSTLVESLPELASRHCPQSRLLAYGPHVQVARLQAAQEAGFPQVMTRGQFDRDLPTLFKVD